MDETKEAMAENVADKEQKRGRGRPKKADTDNNKSEKVVQEELPLGKFEFSDEDIADFKEWKRAKELKSQIKADSPDDDAIYRAWKDESRMVTGIYRCREPAGGSVKFCFKKYKWDPLRWYTMVDGETYTVPLAVARHLNARCSYNEHSHILGPDGNPVVNQKAKTISRMNFESTEFAVA